ncbi:MAG: PAS domain S-box protein [Gammaproteobacteria bacterium]|nr:PAS domain S-box protein [Gammaproteobacteria bacterium]
MNSGRPMSIPGTATEAASERGQTLLGFAVSQSPAIFYVADYGGDRPLHFISSNIETITGHAVASFQADPRYGRRFVHSDDLQGYDETLDQLAERQSLSHEYRFRTIDGRWLWFRDELRLIRDQATGGAEFVGCMIDITAEKITQEKLLEVERGREHLSKLLDDAIDGLTSGFAIHDRNDRLIRCNRAFARPFGLSPEALIGTSREENIRYMLSLTRRFDGRAVTATEADVAMVSRRLDSVESGGVEVELFDGTWLLITCSRTSTGDLVTIRTDITRQKATEIALRVSEDRFRGIVENAPVCIHEIDLEGRVRSMNPKGLEMMGTTDAGKVEGRKYLEFVIPEERPRVEALINRALAGERQTFEFRGNSSKPSYYQSWKIPVRDQYGNIEKLIGIAADITERKQHETTLQQARETLEDAIESLSEGFALYDSEDRLVMCNERYLEFNSLCRDVIRPGVRFEDVARAGAERGQYLDAIGRVDEWVAERMADRQLPVALEVQQSDGRWFARSHRKTRQGGAVVIRSDITERKEMERALRESEALIRRVVENCPVPIGMTRAENGEIIYESPASQALFGLGPHEPGRTTQGRYVNPGDRQRYIEQLRERGYVDGYEVELQTPDGKRFWGAISARLIEFQGEEVIVSSTLDLTERLQVEAEMARQRELLHQSEKLSALGELLAGVAHELNNPLSVVVGQALLLKETSSDPAIADRAARIGNAADRCARIVKTFLAMARQRPAEVRPVNINDVVEAALEVTGYSLRSSNIDVRLRLTRDMPPVRADADQLNQVLTNLIVNAQHALESQAGVRQLKITSSVRRKSGVVVLKVKDNGPGIAPEIRSRIFDPFFTTKEVGTGTGIGLAVCHRIIESHGGVIEVESDSGEGSSFAIRLPYIADSGPGDAEHDGADASDVERVSVLVVDDETDVAAMLFDVLTADGHEVEIAHSGHEALEKIHRKRFDVILSDLKMPGLDGPGLYAALEATRPDLLARLAFITGDTMSPKVKSFLAGTGRPYIEKPVIPSDLRNLVSSLSGIGGDHDPGG